MTATLFNQNYTPATGRNGGAGALGRAAHRDRGRRHRGLDDRPDTGAPLIERGVSITLLESPWWASPGWARVDALVGGFFDSLGIEEAEWMPACHATYKCGIAFEGWSTKPGFERYFHPFASMLDNLTMRQFVHNADARVKGADLHAHPDRFFIAARLAAQRRAPKPADNFPFDIWHGYHFDAVLLGQFLQRKAIERGVSYRSCHVTHATLDAQGGIASVSTQDGETIAADLFVDLQRLCRTVDRQGATYPVRELCR
jgi:hypothetical protein